ncbi:MAG TPA: hypothetical protein VFF13_00875 [archaeon]|nr:hypothetical protein [archaeon]
MHNVMVSVSSDLKKKMNSFPETNWSGVARKAFAERIKLLEKMDKLLSKSSLTEEETISLGRKVKRTVSQRFLQA